MQKKRIKKYAMSGADRTTCEVWWAERSEVARSFLFAKQLESAGTHCFRKHPRLGGDDVEVLTQTKPGKQHNHGVPGAHIRAVFARNSTSGVENISRKDGVHVEHDLSVVNNVGEIADFDGLEIFCFHKLRCGHKKNNLNDNDANKQTDYHGPALTQSMKTYWGAQKSYISRA